MEKLEEIAEEARLPRGFDEGAGLSDVLREVTEEALTGGEAWAGSNVVVWWTAVLVRSALSGEDDEDYISRGAFAMNILPMDLGLADRVEAIGHYGRALVLDRAFRKLDGGAGGPDRRRVLTEVQEALNAVDSEWLNGETGPRPERTGVDDERCSSPSWRAMLALLEQEARQHLGGRGETAMGKVAALHQKLKSVRGG